MRRTSLEITLSGLNHFSIPILVVLVCFTHYLTPRLWSPNTCKTWKSNGTIECSMICLWPWLDHRRAAPKRQRWDWSGRRDRGCPVRTSANPRIRECAGLELTGMRCQATLRIKKGHDVAAIVSPFPQLSSASSLDFRESHDSNSSPISLCFLVFLGDTGLLGAESAYW